MEKGGGQDQLISIQCYRYIITVPLPFKSVQRFLYNSNTGLNGKVDAWVR